MKIAHSTVVTAAYTFRDEEGHVLENSDKSGPMIYLHGLGAVLPAIEAALEGQVAGQCVALTLPPEQAFGAHRAELVFEAMRANLPADIVLEPGTELFSGMGDRAAFRLRVVSLTDTGALLDGNHPMAGKTLQIDVKVLDVRAATPDELADGRATPMAA
jgi:FKBP-type peptidyl-prolyl cis-trans isomerase SlyD